MLAREVLRLRGTLANREVDWDVVVDLYFYRDPEAEEQKEEEKAPGAEEAGTGTADRGFTAETDWQADTATAPGIEGAAAPATNWGADQQAGTADWAAEGQAGASGW